MQFELGSDGGFCVRPLKKDRQCLRENVDIRGLRQG